MVLPPVDESLLSQLAEMGTWRFSFVFGLVWFGMPVRYQWCQMPFAKGCLVGGR